MPLPLVLILLCAGLAFHSRARHRRTGWVLVLLAALILGISAFEPCADLLLAPLERQYAPFENRDVPVSYVIVLGSGHCSAAGLPLSSQLSPSALIRLNEGIHIYRQHPGSRIILSGWGGRDPRSHASVLADMARELGVPERDIITEPRPRDTAEEARLIAPLVDDAPCILVSSAAHLPRALALFRQQGMTPHPAPTEFLVHRGPPRLYPNSGALRKTERAIHEYLGITWARLRGQI